MAKKNKKNKQKVNRLIKKLGSDGKLSKKDLKIIGNKSNNKKYTIQKIEQYKQKTGVETKKNFQKVIKGTKPSPWQRMLSVGDFPSLDKARNTPKPPGLGPTYPTPPAMLPIGDFPFLDGERDFPSDKPKPPGLGPTYPTDPQIKAPESPIGKKPDHVDPPYIPTPPTTPTPLPPPVVPAPGLPEFLTPGAPPTAPAPLADLGAAFNRFTNMYQEQMNQTDQMNQPDPVDPRNRKYVLGIRSKKTKNSKGVKNAFGRKGKRIQGITNSSLNI